jgi:hypothetical protein
MHNMLAMNINNPHEDPAQDNRCPDCDAQVTMVGGGAFDEIHISCTRCGWETTEVDPRT